MNAPVDEDLRQRLHANAFMAGPNQPTDDVLVPGIGIELPNAVEDRSPRDQRADRHRGGERSAQLFLLMCKLGNPEIVRACQRNPELRPSCETRRLSGQFVRMPEVIRVQKRDQVASSEMEAGIARCGGSGILLPLISDTVARAGQRIRWLT